jgi:hypothetical protein
MSKVSSRMGVKRAVRGVTDPDKMREVYDHLVRDYSRKKYGLNKGDAEGRAKEEILFDALGVDKATYNRWAKIIKE